MHPVNKFSRITRKIGAGWLGVGFQDSFLRSFATWSIGNALRVAVLTLPSFPNAGRSVNAISSFRASTMETKSRSLIV